MIFQKSSTDQQGVSKIGILWVITIRFQHICIKIFTTTLILIKCTSFFFSSEFRKKFIGRPTIPYLKALGKRYLQFEIKDYQEIYKQWQKNFTTKLGETDFMWLREINTKAMSISRFVCSCLLCPLINVTDQFPDALYILPIHKSAIIFSRRCH